MNLKPDFSCSDTFNGTYDNECHSNCTGLTYFWDPGATMAKKSYVFIQNIFLKNPHSANQS